jgi:hypothetical protein
MKRLFVIGSFLLVVGWAASAWAVRPLPIDPPSPPPCGPDGNCYPNEGEWGYYPNRWRQWPGVNLKPTPETKAPTPAEQLGPNLTPYETPSPEEEDEAAPPSTTKAEQPETPPGPLGPQSTTEGAQPPSGAVPGGPLPRSTTPGAPLPGGPLPGAPAPNRMVPSPSAPPTVPYSESTRDDDPPPTVPSTLTSGDPPLSRPGSAGPKASQAEARPPAPNNDPPPTPSWLYRSASL